MKKLFALLVASAAGLCAQSLSVGVIGGAPFSDVTSDYTSRNLNLIPQSKNFVVGPSLQVNLPLSLRLEVDGLYRPYSFSVSGLPNATAQDWNFPLLLQYRFKTPVVKPFVEAGVSFDHLANISAAAKSVTSGPGQLINQSSSGLILGGGLDVKIPFVRLSGELRYSHQNSAFFQQISNVNQAEFLLGVHF